MANELPDPSRRVPARDIEILRLRETGATLAAIGRDLHISAERVRQLEARARRRIRRDLFWVS